MADDDESLDEILSGSAKPETAEPPDKTTEAPEASDVPRDEHGRFAPKEGEAEPEVDAEQPEATTEPEPEAEHNAPVAAVIAERRKGQAATERADKLERELAEMRGQMSVLMQRGTQAAPQPQPEPVKPPEFWENPEAFLQHALTPYQQQIADMTVRTSRAEALVEFGRDTVVAAENAVKEAIQRGELDPVGLKASLSKSRDPVGDVVRWHQGSPASIREKLKAEIMAELGIDPSKQPAPSPTPSSRDPVVRLPPSLSKVPAGHAAPERDESLDEVLSAPRRRA